MRLLVEILEPFHGRVLDPACGSGGMFVQSARFVAEHRKNPAAELSIHGIEKTDETGRLCRMNLAVHGLEGDIRHDGNVNSYYDDPHDDTWFGSTLDAIKTLDWAAIRATDWRGKTHQKSAEFLVADFFPWTDIHAIGCHNSGVARQVQDLVNSQHHRPAVSVEPTWYY